MADYSFKRIDASCYNDLVGLFEAAFNHKTTSEYYKQKMNTGYLGVSHLGYLAYDNENKAAAFYGVYPYMTAYKGKQYLAAQSGDTMTHPKHVGKGLFTTLAKMTYELAKQEGIQFIFGFPNENSLPGFVRKLSWVQDDNLKNYKWQVLTFPCAAIAKKFPFLLPFHKSYVNLVLSFFKSDKEFLPNSVFNSETGGVHRSKEFSNYKSFYNNHLVKIADTYAWIKTDGVLVIGDIELKDKINVEQTVASIKRLAFWLGCNQIIFPVSKGTAWDTMLRNKAEFEKGIYVGYLDLQSNLPLQNFKYVFADSDTF